jgi:hypothetical protein
MSLVKDAARAQRLDRLEVEVLEDGPDLSLGHGVAITDCKRATVAKNAVRDWRSSRRGLARESGGQAPACQG